MSRRLFAILCMSATIPPFVRATQAKFILRGNFHYSDVTLTDVSGEEYLLLCTEDHGGLRCFVHMTNGVPYRAHGIILMDKLGIRIEWLSHSPSSGPHETLLRKKYER